MDLAALRSTLRLTQAEFAEKIGVSPGHVGDIERGHRRLTVDLAAKIERVFKRKGLVAAVVAERRGAAA